jgi:hypothetical protein
LDLGETEAVEGVSEAGDRDGRHAEDGPLTGMAERERGKVEVSRQLCRQGRAPELDRRRLRRRGDDRELRVVQLGSAGGARHHLAGDREHRLGQKLGDVVGVAGIGDDDLAEAAAVAQDQERDLAEAALAVKPARQAHLLPDVIG